MKLFSKVKTRFAPSPTGYLHIGSCRTALFNYLFSKKNRGEMVLRIEDTDKERSKKEYEEDIVESLEWLGIKWKEMFRQSERTDIYRNYLEKLLKEKKAYYCYCTPEELEAQRQDQESRGAPLKYSGKCSHISEQDNKGKKSVIRLRMPEKKIIVEDLIRGKIEFDCSLIGDIVIAKDLETPLYNLTAVIDDYEMKITHVIRGEDILPNTPKQIALQEALGFSTPAYAHLPMILAPDKSKLSKRHGAVSATEYRKEGYLAEAAINMIALLGWNPGTDKEIYSLKELEKDFLIEKVQNSGAVFNIQKLDYLNGWYIRQKSLDELAGLCLPYLIQAGYIVPVFKDQERFENFTGYFGKEIIQKEYIIGESKEKISFEKIKEIVGLYQERMKKLSEISELTDYFFKDIAYDKSLLVWKNATEEETKQSIDTCINILSGIKEWKKEKIEEELAKAAGKDRGVLLWPLRAALSGKKSSASPFDIAYVLGREKTLKRLKQAL